MSLLSRRGVLAALAGVTGAALSACSNKTEGQVANTTDANSPAPGTDSATPAAPGSTSKSPSASPSAAPTAKLPDGVLNVLVIGSDLRGKADIRKGNSDVICLVQLTADRKRLNMVSIARDTLATLPNGKQGKINSIYPQWGPKSLSAEVGRQLGVEVHHFMEIGFIGFRRVTLLLEKIVVDNRYATNTEGFDFPKGKVTLPLERQALGALWFNRERKHLPNGDLDRTERQRATLTGIMVRLAELANTDEEKLRAMLPALWRCMRQGGTITTEMAASLIPTLKTMKASDVSSVILPVQGFGMVGGASVDIINKQRAAELAAALKKADLSGYIAKYGTSNATTG